MESRLVAFLFRLFRPLANLHVSGVHIYEEAIRPDAVVDLVIAIAKRAAIDALYPLPGVFAHIHENRLLGELALKP